MTKVVRNPVGARSNEESFERNYRPGN